MSTNFQWHDEILVNVVDGAVATVHLLDENTHPYHDGRVWDIDDETWRSIDADERELEDRCIQRAVRWVAFPFRVREIFEESTTGDGWDINIMSDIMRELIELGVVSPNEEIAE